MSQELLAVLIVLGGVVVFVKFALVFGVWTGKIAKSPAEQEKLPERD